MFTVAVWRLKLTIAEFFAVFSNNQRDHCFILVVLKYRFNIIYYSFLVPTTFGAQFVFHLHFCQSLPNTNDAARFVCDS